jgi:hypothetical protein
MTQFRKRECSNGPKNHGKTCFPSSLGSNYRDLRGTTKHENLGVAGTEAHPTGYLHGNEGLR